MITNASLACFGADEISQEWTYLKSWILGELAFERLDTGNARN
jgi:hypothetical protein